MMSGNENPADKAKQDALYEDREPKKIIRLITVTAYMVSVSFVGIVLSIYYVFLWHPPNPRLMHAQAQAEHHERLEGAIEYLRQEQDHRPSSVLSIKLPADGSNTMTLADVQPVDLFYGERHRQENSSKTRREILKNFNAILSANFDRTKSTSEATSTIMESPGESSLSSDTSQFATVTKHNGVIAANEEEIFATAETTITTSPSVTMTTTPTTSSPTKEAVTSPASMTTRSIKKTKLTAKKPHQTPFALKHLEVPIQSDSIKRRQGGLSSTASPILFYSTQADRAVATLERLMMQIPRKMSAQNVMASISRTLGTRHGEAKPTNEVKFAGEESKDRLYEPKHKQKLVRVLTVVAYIICVSMAAIVLSLYYMYIWDPSDPHFKQLKLNLTAGLSLGGNGKLVQAPCNEVTPLVLAINEDISDDDEVPSVFEPMYERTGSSDSPLQATTSNKFNEGPERARQLQGSKSLLKILTTLPSSHSQQDDIYYPKATDQPIINGNEDYRDATMLPVAADDLLDD